MLIFQQNLKVTEIVTMVKIKVIISNLLQKKFNKKCLINIFQLLNGKNLIHPKEEIK
jgi:hypothetical protein